MKKFNHQPRRSSTRLINHINYKETRDYRRRSESESLGDYGRRSGTDGEERAATGRSSMMDQMDEKRMMKKTMTMMIRNQEDPANGEGRSNL